MNTDILSLDMRLLAAFDALLEERNVTRAAERLAVTQQAMSGMLARLRALFGDPLFVRARYGVTPTPRAEAMAAEARELLARGERLLQGRAFDPASAEGVLRVSAMGLTQHAILTPFVARMRRAAPGVRFALLPYEIEGLAARFQERALDLALTVPPLAPPDCLSRGLHRGSWVCIAGGSDPLRGKRLTLKRYLQRDHVVVSPTDATFRGSADEALKRIGQKRRVVLSVPDFMICCDMVERTDLLAVVPELALRSHTGSLLRFPVPFEIPIPPLIAVWPRWLDADPLHRWARGQLAELAAEME